jgi:hypothetical protein
MALLVTDEATKALLKLAAEYEAMAEKLRIAPPDRRE